MKIARIEVGEDIFYASADANEFEIINGDIFGEFELSGRKIASSDCELLAPVEPKQIIAIGLNYKKHADECGMKYPEAPVVFIKANSSLAGPGDNIVLPQMAPDEVDFEAELTIVIGKTAKNITQEQADDYILGYTCGNDVSARDCQLRLDVQWARGKSFDTFAPIGPWITTGLDGDNLNISLTLNGRKVQDSNTSDLLFGCRYLVSYLSRCMTLAPGTVIMTGTPSGVGMGRTPKLFLKEGDNVSVEIEGIGTLQNTVTL